MELRRRVLNRPLDGSELSSAGRAWRASRLTEEEAIGPRHLLWIPAAGAVGFLSAFAFGDVLPVPPQIYPLLYAMLVVSFLAVYAARTRIRLIAAVRHRLVLGVALGLVVGLVLVQRAFADPPTSGPSGWLFVSDVLVRGVIYGLVDGMLLSAFPWLVTWRAFGGEACGFRRRLAINLLALVLALAVTSTYHLGYADFRGRKLAQANLGNAIASLATLVSMNPVASPIGHAALHVAAVIHNPQSDLFLPPH